MWFNFDHDTPLYQNFRKECIDKDCWHNISWDSTFKLMGFKTYAYNGDHYLADHEFTWFVLRFS
jgi:hypothetical protein